MDWLAPAVLRLTEEGSWAPILFVLIYIAAALTMAPAFFLTVAAGAMFGVWRGSLIVFIGASLGASAVYALSATLTRSSWMSRVLENPRIAVARQVVAGEGLWMMFLLRLSPLVPYTPLNYALALSGVRYVDFLIALLGMIPTIIMYTYYGKVVGDVAELAAGVSPRRGPEYYVLLVVGLVAIGITTTMITKAARRAVARQQRHP